MRGDKTVYSDRGKGPRMAEALLLNASDREAEESVWRFRTANRKNRFWWEPAGKGAHGTV